MVAAPLVPVRSSSVAQFAHCDACDQWLGCQYWPLSKSVALHKRGTGHVVRLFSYWLAEVVDFGGEPMTRAEVYAWFADNLYPVRAAELWLIGYENTHGRMERAA